MLEPIQVPHVQLVHLSASLKSQPRICFLQTRLKISLITADRTCFSLHAVCGPQDQRPYKDVSSTEVK